MVDELNLNDGALIEEMMTKRRSSGRLLEESKRKAENEKEALRRIKQKRGLALTEDANPPFTEFVSQVKNNSNKSGEPSELLWQPVTIEKIMSLYPQRSAISDVNTVISASNQQPGVPFPLVGPGDKRGEMFVKTDNSGNFYLAQGDKNPKVFVNPSASSDDANWDAPGKVSIPTTSSFDKPQINTTDLRHIVSSMAEEIKQLKQELKSLKEGKEELTEGVASNRRELLEKKMTISQQMEGMDDKSKEVIQRLLGAAQQLRTGAAIVDAKTAPVASSILTEDVKPETKAVKISTNKLHEMLLKTTKKLNSNKTEVLETLADNISNLIAENLLTNEIGSSAYLKQTMNTYKKLIG